MSLPTASSAPAVGLYAHCAACGVVNSTSRKFCFECGAPLNNATPLDSTTVPVKALLPAEIPTSGLHGFGWFLVFLGFLAMAIGATLRTTVTAESTYVLGQAIGGNTIHNIGLLTRNVMILMCGGFTAVTGAVLVAAGAAVDVRESLRRDVRTAGSGAASAGEMPTV